MVVPMPVVVSMPVLIVVGRPVRIPVVMRVVGLMLGHGSLMLGLVGLFAFFFSPPPPRYRPQKRR